MSLYPTIILDAETAAADPVAVLSSTIVIIPIDMNSVQMTQLMLFQMDGVDGRDKQDFSLRAWVSKIPTGNPIASPVYEGVGNYPVPRWGGAPIVVYNRDQLAPEQSFSIPVDPGICYLNVLNLTNEDVYFGFTKTDLI